MTQNDSKSISAKLPTAPGTVQGAAVRTPWSEFWRKFRKQQVAVIALVFVLLLVLVAALAPYISPYDAENYFDYDKLNDGPSWQHWLGVDGMARRYADYASADGWTWVTRSRRSVR